jgi:hypothetical protein
MKRLLATIVAASTIFISSNAFANPPTSAEQLRSEFEVALKAKNTNAVLSLFNWEGVPPENKNLAASVVEYTVSGGLQDGDIVKLSPLSDDDMVEYASRGFRYFPNVSIIGTIEINQQSRVPNGVTSLNYGKKGNAFYFPGYLKEPAPASFKAFNISIMGNFTEATPFSFIGSCIYAISEKTLKKQIHGTNNLSLNLFGKQIKSCSVNRTSGNGWMHIVISENDTNIFDSGIVETNSISFEPKN